MQRSGKFITAILFSALMVGLLTISTVGVQARERSQQAEFVAPIMVVNASFLNVRTGPGIEYSILLTVVGGTELPVLGVASDLVWYQVSTIAGVGWVNSAFTLPRGDFRNVPFVEAPAITAPGVVQPAPSDDSVGGVGFSQGRQWGISVAEAHPFRTQATINSGSPGTISARNDIIYTVLAANTGDGVVWYQINDETLGTGWVEGPKTTFRPHACELTAVVALREVRPIIGPDGSGTLDGNVSVAGGDEAYLIDASGPFFKLELLDGNNGWVAAADMAVRDEMVRSQFCEAGGTDMGMGGGTLPDETAGSTETTVVGPSTPRVVINTGFLNLRSGPGAQFTVVTTLPGGTVLPVIGVAPDGVWFLVSGTFGQAWLNIEFALFRGEISVVPVVDSAMGGQLATPMARITNAVTLYAAPDLTLGTVGALSGPLDVDVVARTADFNWVQIGTTIGFGWVLTDQVELMGDTSLIPVVGG